MADTTRLPEPQRRALGRLSAMPLEDGFYLAGETAIAMHLGHRTSLDLAFFSMTPDVDLDVAKAAVRGRSERPVAKGLEPSYRKSWLGGVLSR